MSDGVSPERQAQAASGSSSDRTLGVTGATLALQIEQAKLKRQELLDKRELERLQAEIALLERGQRGRATPAESIADSEDLLTKKRQRRSSSDSDAPRSVKRSAKLKDPTPYSGASLKQYRNFVRDCELASKNAPAYFPSEEDLVTWAMQYLEGDVKETWWAQYERMQDAEEPISWNHFTTYILDTQIDPVNRGLDAVILYNKAAQRPGQTTRAFATYLETLESQLPFESEAARVQILFAKLRFELQTAITNAGNVPLTREGLITVATTKEKNLKRSAQGDRPERPGRLPTEKKQVDVVVRNEAGSPSGRRSNASSDLHKGLKCYNCQEMGHISPNCTKPRKERNSNRTPVNNVRAAGKG
jgi:hypothetical protein